jgi:EAL domain-containing protein (putative c-di-GMP-specific phosphodiesterase class I)
MNSVRTAFRLREIMETERLSTHFQPIVSLKTGEIFAYEALVRGIRIDSPELITPCELFAQADEETVSKEFDHLCRKKALEDFQDFRPLSTAMMFMNINTSTINGSSADKPHIDTITQQMGFNPQHIGLEFIESRSTSSEDLVHFANDYRDSGFLIIIDDFGCEHSNLDRLIQIHPDIIKVDRNIICGIENDPYRQSILKSIHSLAEMTGSLCLAEGVETIAEIRTCHLLGVDLFQGFAIAYPSPKLSALEAETKARVRALQGEIRKITVDSIKLKRRLTGDINVIADWLIRQIVHTNFDDLLPVFREFIAMNGEIECIYVIDGNGTQLSDTACSDDLDRQTRPSIFKPAIKGVDHSFKPYFTCFEALGINRYLTDVYLSLASGNLCRTLAIRLEIQAQPGLILCIDFLEENIRTAPFPVNAHREE